MGDFRRPKWLFYLITIIVVGGIIYYLYKYAKGKPLLGISLAFMLGGAIGNFIDRLIRQEVVDFLYARIMIFQFSILQMQA